MQTCRWIRRGRRRSNHRRPHSVSQLMIIHRTEWVGAPTTKMIKQSRIVRDQFPRADRTVRHRSSANRGFIGTFLVTMSVCAAPAEPKGLDSPYKENACALPRSGNTCSAFGAQATTQTTETPCGFLITGTSSRRHGGTRPSLSRTSCTVSGKRGRCTRRVALHDYALVGSC
jgi:hypothetical protein